MIYNAENILPTFNYRYALPENIVIHQEFGYILKDNEMGSYFDNSILGSGLVIRIRDGPRMSRCVTKYKSTVGLIGPDNPIFNQELGSCFGASIEPPFRPYDYSTVFSNPTDSMSYSEYDYMMAKVYLDRSKIHYRNISSAPMPYHDRLDWDGRPDIVEQFYNEGLIGSKSSGNEVFEKTVFDEDGGVLKKESWKLSEVPYDVMSRYPMLFTEQEVQAQKLRQTKPSMSLRR